VESTGVFTDKEKAAAHLKVPILSLSTLVTVSLFLILYVPFGVCLYKHSYRLVCKWFMKQISFFFIMRNGGYRLVGATGELSNACIFYA
jgi:hypothetical protein